MAIRIRRGKEEDLDFSKLKEAELALTTDTKKLFFCYSPGSVKQLQTAEELQNLLDASPEAYQALQQLIADLSANPSELANILSSISALESGKVSKTDLVQTDQVNNPEKVPSSTVTHALGQEIDTLNNNLVNIKVPISRQSLSGGGNTLTFNATSGNDIYLILTHQAGTLTNARSANLVFCAWEGYNGTVAPILASTDILITVSEKTITVKNNAAGAATVTLIQLG